MSGGKAEAGVEGCIGVALILGAIALIPVVLNAIYSHFAERFGLPAIYYWEWWGIILGVHLLGIGLSK